MLAKATNAMKSLIENGTEWKIFELIRISVNQSKTIR
jgi:hypothetical protein